MQDCYEWNAMCKKCDSTLKECRLCNYFTFNSFLSYQVKIYHPNKRCCSKYNISSEFLCIIQLLVEELRL